MNRLDRIMISSLCLSMISGQTLRVCPEGKPGSTFPDHAVESRRDAPSQHDRRVERTIKPDAVAERGPAIALRERNRALAPCRTPLFFPLTSRSFFRFLISLIL